MEADRSVQQGVLRMQMEMNETVFHRYLLSGLGHVYGTTHLRASLLDGLCIGQSSPNMYLTPGHLKGGIHAGLIAASGPLG